MRSKSIYKDMEQSELEFSKFLKALNIKWAHEQPICVYDEKKRPRIWTPDFYLPDFGVYVEVCGSKDFDYEYREMVFLSNGIPVIFLHFYKNKNKWRSYFIHKLKEITENRNNFIKIIENRYRRL